MYCDGRIESSFTLQWGNGTPIYYIVDQKGKPLLHY